MKALLPWLGALLLTTAAGSLAQADYPYYYPCIPQAPDMCGPGYFCTNWCGTVYGPSYCIRPPWEPFQGARPCLQQQQGAVSSGHLFARSPRDFFMVDP